MRLKAVLTLFLRIVTVTKICRSSLDFDIVTQVTSHAVVISQLVFHFFPTTCNTLMKTWKGNAFQVLDNDIISI